METNNLLGISDQAMVQQVYAEKPHGGAVTLAVYDRYSAFGFRRLRKTNTYNALSDFEKREVAYDAAGRFLETILTGKYEPLADSSSAAYFWTICHRRAVDVLRKLATSTGTYQGEEKDQEVNPAPVQASFVQRHSFDDDQMPPLKADLSDRIGEWLDMRLIWETAKRKLGEPCYAILVETVQKDRPHLEVSLELGYTIDSLKSMKTRCLKQLRDLLRGEF